MTSLSRHEKSASCYQSRSSMYIRGVFPRNSKELAEAVPIACIKHIICVWPHNTDQRSGKKTKLTYTVSVVWYVICTSEFPGVPWIAPLLTLVCDLHLRVPWSSVVLHVICNSEFPGVPWVGLY